MRLANMPAWHLDLPCPFCGEALVIDALDLRVQIWKGEPPRFSVVCLYCEIAFPIDAERISRDGCELALRRHRAALAAHDPVHGVDLSAR